MNEYKTETHSHSSETSKCSHITGSELVKGYKKKGYSTICITDHYFDGFFQRENIVDLSVEEKIDAFMSGYNNAKLIGINLGIYVIFGIELRLVGEKEDYLIYGLTKEFLLENINIYKMQLPQVREILEKSGLDYLLIQAHPFRSSCVYPELLDGIEVYNSHNHLPEMNEKAFKCANEYNLRYFSGTDCHDADWIARGGIITRLEITNVDEFIKFVKGEKYRIIEEEYTKFYK